MTEKSETSDSSGPGELTDGTGVDAPVPRVDDFRAAAAALLNPLMPVKDPLTAEERRAFDERRSQRVTEPPEDSDTDPGPSPTPEQELKSALVRMREAVDRGIAHEMASYVSSAATPLMDVHGLDFETARRVAQRYASAHAIRNGNVTMYALLKGDCNDDEKKLAEQLEKL